jgi:hypothetical protein
MPKGMSPTIKTVQTIVNAFVSNLAIPAFLGLMTISIVLHAILEGFQQHCMSCTKMIHHWPVKPAVLASINLIRQQRAQIVLLDGTMIKRIKMNV